MALMAKDYNDVFMSASTLDRLNLYWTIVQLKIAQTPVDQLLASQRSNEPLVQEVNLKQVANLTQRNYGSLYNMYNDLTEMLTALLPAGVPADVPHLFAVPEGALRFSLVKASAPYQYLQALLSRQYDSFNAFVTATGLSRMTVMRHLKPLKTLAGRFGVSLQTEKFQLAGDERRIRLVLTLAFWEATSGYDWPFVAMPHDLAAAAIQAQLKAVDYHGGNPVSLEVAAYYYAVASYRVADGHVISHAPGLAVLDYPLPDMSAVVREAVPAIKDVALPQVDLTPTQAMGESEFFYFLVNFAPLYVGGDDTGTKAMIQRFARYSPALYQLVTAFLQKFPGEVPLASLGHPLQEQLTADWLAITASTVSLGIDFNQLVAYAYNRTVKAIPDDPELLRRVHQTLENVLVTAEVEQFESLLDPLTEAYYRNMLQCQALYLPQVKVKVALMMEQTMLGYVDLTAMLNQQAYVELVSPTDGEPDLIVIGAEMPLSAAARGHAIVFHWPVSATADRFGALYGVITELWRERLGAMAVGQQHTAAQ